MPTYVYKAMTKSGLVVKNKIESPSRQNLLKTLKSNELLPIDVQQIRYVGRQQRKAKKNITAISAKAQNTSDIQKMGMRDSVYLSTQLKSPNGTAFENINLPSPLIAAIEHDYALILRHHGKSSMSSKTRKESKNMKPSAKTTQRPVAKKSKFKYTKQLSLIQKYVRIQLCIGNISCIISLFIFC